MVMLKMDVHQAVYQELKYHAVKQTFAILTKLHQQKVQKKSKNFKLSIIFNF